MHWVRLGLVKHRYDEHGVLWIDVRDAIRQRFYLAPAPVSPIGVPAKPRKTLRKRWADLGGNAADSRPEKVTIDTAGEHHGAFQIQ